MLPQIGHRPVDEEPGQVLQKSALAHEVTATLDEGLDTGLMLVAKGNVTRAADELADLHHEPEGPGGDTRHVLVGGLQSGVDLGEEAVEHPVGGGQEEVLQILPLHTVVRQQKGGRPTRPQRVAEPAAPLALGAVHEDVQGVEQQSLLGRLVDTVDVVIRAEEGRPLLVGVGILQNGQVVYRHRTHSAEIYHHIPRQSRLHGDHLGQPRGNVETGHVAEMVGDRTVRVHDLGADNVDGACLLAGHRQTDEAHTALPAVPCSRRPSCCTIWT